jgi:hypothetical protein
MQDGVKNVEVGIAFLESFHVLFQAIRNELFVLCSNARILTLADLHHHFIKALLVESIYLDRVAGLAAEKVFIVVTDLAIISFLPGIITHGGFLEKLIVCFGYRLAHESDIVGSAERVNIRRHKLPVIVSQRTVSLTERYSLFFHSSPFFFHWIYLSLSTKSNHQNIGITTFRIDR